MKPGQFRSRLASGFDHVFREPKDAIDGAHNGVIAHEGSLAFDPGDPAFPLQFEQGFAGGGIADPVLLDDFVFRGYRLAGSELAALDAGDDLTADLIVFWRAKLIGIHWREW